MFAGPADDDIGVVESKAQQSDEQPELQHQDADREGDAGHHLDQQLMPEAVGRPFEIIAGDRNAAEQRVAAEAEQRPADLLPKVDQLVCLMHRKSISTAMIMKLTKKD